MQELPLQLVTQMIADRRTIHKRPELGWTEFETTYFIAKRLEKLQIEFQLGGDFLDRASVHGRDEQEVQTAIQRALEHGVPKTFIKKTQGYTGVAGILIPADQVQPLQYEQILMRFRSKKVKMKHMSLSWEAIAPKYQW